MASKLPQFLLPAVTVALALLAVLALPASSLAAGPSPDAISQIAQEFYTKTSAWSGTLKSFAFALFRWTVMLEIALFGIRMALQRSQLPDILSQFVMTLLFAGFIAAVINNYAEWSWNLIRGLASTADSLGTAQTSSDAPLRTGLNLVQVILDKVSITSPAESIGYIVAALVVLICFALMTAQILLIKCEAMVAMNASVILLGLGGSSLFKEYAINVMRYALAVAFKLFVLQLLLGLGMTFITDMELSEATLQDIFVVIGVSVVLLALVKTIPDVCAGIINGSHVTGGHALAATAGAVLGGAVGFAAGSVATAAGASMGLKSVRAASQLATESGATGLGKVGHMAQSLYSAHQQTRAEHPRASHALRLRSKMESRLQAKKMENAMREEGADANGE